MFPRLRAESLTADCGIGTVVDDGARRIMLYVFGR
jgi:hypothetical protein